jgi:hypothetical protein
MSIEEWYIRCIKDYLASVLLMKENDTADIVLNESDNTFSIEIHHDENKLKRSKNSTMKGLYDIERDYLNLKFVNKTFKVKI